MKGILTSLLLAGTLAAQVNHQTIKWSANLPKGNDEKKLRVAMVDWKAHKPLPGLPALNKPIYMAKGSYMCNTSSELLNPNVKVLVVMSECMVTTRTIKVKVLQPTDENTYIMQFYVGIVQVTYDTGEVSDGNTYGAWVPIPDLTN